MICMRATSQASFFSSYFQLPEVFLGIDRNALIYLGLYYSALDYYYCLFNSFHEKQCSEHSVQVFLDEKHNIHVLSLALPDFAIQAQWNDLFGYCLMNNSER